VTKRPGEKRPKGQNVCGKKHPEGQNVERQNDWWDKMSGGTKRLEGQNVRWKKNVQQEKKSAFQTHIT
jgi:hypothetical protein